MGTASITSNTSVRLGMPQKTTRSNKQQYVCMRIHLFGADKLYAVEQLGVVLLSLGIAVLFIVTQRLQALKTGQVLRKQRRKQRRA